MKRLNLKYVFCIISLLLVNNSFSQTKIERSSSQVQTSVEYTALKPENGRPFFFSTQQDLDFARQNKIGLIKEDIKKNILNPKRVKELREDLWRIENAIVQNKQKK